MRYAGFHEIERSDRQGTPSVIGAVFFFVLYCVLYYVSQWTVHAVAPGRAWHVELMWLVWFVLTVAAARLFDADVLGSKYWHGSSILWKGIWSAVALQCFLGFSQWPGLPYIPYDVVAISFAPVTEEIVRAVMLNAMEARWGGGWAVVSTALLFASVHPFFWSAVFQCALLALISLKSHKSLPCAMAAHYAMNLIAVGAVPWVFHWLQLKLL